MVKKVILPEQEFRWNPKEGGFDYRRSYDDFLDYFKNTIHKKDLESSIHKIENSREILAKAKRQLHSTVNEEFFLSLFLIWSKDNFVKPGYPDYAKMLIEKNILLYKDNDDNLLKVKDIDYNFIQAILESIRCRKDIDLWQKEMLVLTYVDFIKWTVNNAVFLVLDFEDIDKEKASSKSLKYDDFIKFIDKLDDKFRVVAKLLYLGDKVTLEQVLSLNIQDIIFSEQRIIFGESSFYYSLHVLDDLKSIIGKKTFGRVFLGRQDNPLNPATIFRNFKEAAIKAGLDSSFSPKTLIQRKEN